MPVTGNLNLNFKLLYVMINFEVDFCYYIFMCLVFACVRAGALWMDDLTDSWLKLLKSCGIAMAHKNDVDLCKLSGGNRRSKLNCLVHGCIRCRG